MRLTEPDIKIKCTNSHLKTLLEYLSELIDHWENYSLNLFYKPVIKVVYKHHLNSIREKAIKLIFSNVGTEKTNFTLKLNHAERITLFDISAHYPLPLEINFLEYEIKNKLLM